MTKQVFRAPDLAVLMCPRMCHDFSSKLNTILMLKDELTDLDNERREEAADFVGQAADELHARLKFFRLAFACRPSASEMIPVREMIEACEGMFENTQLTFSWEIIQEKCTTRFATLAVNLVTIIQTALPRGGVVRVHGEGENLTLTAQNIRNIQGDMQALPEDIMQVLMCFSPENGIDSKNVQACYTGLLLRDMGKKLQTEFTQDEGINRLLFRTIAVGDERV